MPQVESSLLFSLDRDPDTGDVKAVFRAKDGTAGAAYRYSTVPESVYEAVLNAPSIGKAFTARIKSTFGPGTKL